MHRDITVPIPDSLMTLAGFVFAHATWSVSDLPAGDLLVPLAIVEKSGQRQLVRFEAETQEQAISQGKATLQAHEQDVDAWAFAREGKIQEAGKYVDVLTIEAKATGMSESIIFAQRFQPFSQGQFQLIGEPLVFVGGKSASAEESKTLVAKLIMGVQSHGKAAELWNQWVAR